MTTPLSLKSRLLSLVPLHNYHNHALSSYSLITLTILLAPPFLIWLVLSFFCNRGRYDYKNKHVIITGGSSGIGLEMANIYLKLGCNVTLVARDELKLTQEATRLNELHISKVVQSNDRVCIVSVDITTNEATIKKSFTKCFELFGDCDILVNCAGTSVAAPFEELKDTDFKWMMDINVLGSVYVTRAVLAGMRRKGGGRIVFVSSQLGQVALHGYTAYCASKYALRGLAEALQMEVKSDNIFVSVAYPPDTKTPGYDLENLTKPDLTRILLEGSGQLFSASYVAQAIVNGSTQRLFHIHVGLDGWLLKSTQPGMAPVNNALETTLSVLTPCLCRLIALFYLLSWDSVVYHYNLKKKKELTPTLDGSHGSHLKHEEEKIKKVNIPNSNKRKVV